MVKLPLASSPTAGWPCAPAVLVLTRKAGPVGTTPWTPVSAAPSKSVSTRKASCPGLTTGTGENCRAKTSLTEPLITESGTSLCHVMTKSPSASMATSGRFWS